MIGPQQGVLAPGYGAPAQWYAAPAPAHGGTAPSYGATASVYGPPVCGPPAPGYGAQNYYGQSTQLPPLPPLPQQQAGYWEPNAHPPPLQPQQQPPQAYPNWPYAQQFGQGAMPGIPLAAPPPQIPVQHYHVPQQGYVIPQPPQPVQPYHVAPNAQPFQQSKMPGMPPAPQTQVPSLTNVTEMVEAEPHLEETWAHEPPSSYFVRSLNASTEFSSSTCGVNHAESSSGRHPTSPSPEVHMPEQAMRDAASAESQFPILPSGSRPDISGQRVQPISIPSRRPARAAKTAESAEVANSYRPLRVHLDEISRMTFPATHVREVPPRWSNKWHENAVHSRIWAYSLDLILVVVGRCLLTVPDISPVNSAVCGTIGTQRKN